MLVLTLTKTVKLSLGMGGGRRLLTIFMCKAKQINTWWHLKRCNNTTALNHVTMSGIQ